MIVVSWEQALPENGTERLSKPSGPGVAGRSLGLIEASFDDAVINVGVANLLPRDEVVIGQLTP